MSSVDERIVRMTFDNGEFSKKIGDTIKSLTTLNQTTDKIASDTNGLSAIGKAFEQTEVLAEKAGLHISNVWLKVANILEDQVAGRIVNMGRQIANAMTMEGVADGFREYELKMGSIQTIMMGTGESLATVNKYLDELNTYSDKTIYSFKDMTDNIGKFTNAGVKLDDAVAAIKGIANEAAISGANAQQASHAMYNFSQALSAGYVKLIDWKSIENAQMATVGFKETLLEVASAVGTVSKQSDGMYKVLTKNANGKSMGELVSGTKNFNDSLQQQWMTTEVLTKALQIYATSVDDMTTEERNAYEKELESMGFTKEQIKQFEELGVKATKAASEIKTFSMMMDTLKEAIGSGWAMTWQNIIGDFDEAKALWTEVGNALSDLIGKQADARNQILGQWKEAGGRTDVIDGMRHALTELGKALKPIGDAFREVFPRKTAADLWQISRAFRDFAFQLKISGETIDKIGRTAKGFFSLLDIGLKFVKSFVNAILPAGNGILSLGSSLLDATANVGDFITNLDKSITEGKVFESMFSAIGEVVSPIFNLFKSGASGILGFFSSLFAQFASSTDVVKSVGDTFQRIGESLSKGVGELKSKLSGAKPMLETLSKLAKSAGNVILEVLKQLEGKLSAIGTSSNPLGNLSNILTSFLAGKTIIAVSRNVSSLAAITDIFNSVQDALKGFQDNLEAATLIQIATAIGIMAASLILVASVDEKKLLAATAAISAMAFSLAGSVSLLIWALKSFSSVDATSSFKLFGKEFFGSKTTKMLATAKSLKDISKALVNMGAAVALMAVGLKMVSSAAEGGHLWDSFAVITLLLAELTGIAIVLQKFGGGKIGNLAGIIALAAALSIVVKALRSVADGIGQDAQSMDTALAYVSVLLVELAGIATVMSLLGGIKIGNMLGVISLAVSLNLVVNAMKTVADAIGTNGETMKTALGYVSILLGELMVATTVMGKLGGAGSLAAGIGAIGIAASMLILVQALKQINDLLSGDNHVVGALAVIGVALVELAIGLKAMNMTLPGSAALLIASAALVVLGEALKIIGSTDLWSLVKGLGAMALGLSAFALGLGMMVGALPGAAALLVASAALVVFAGALRILGDMSLWEVVKGLSALILGLVSIGVIGAVLSIVSPLMLAFAAALGAVGAACIVAGAGMVVLAAGLGALLTLIPECGGIIKTLLVMILELIPVLIENIMDGIGVLNKKIVEYGPVFIQAFITILEGLLKAIVQSAVKIAEAVYTVISEILRVLAENIPSIAKNGADMIVAFVKAMEENLPRVVEAAYKCAVTLIESLATSIEENNGALIQAVDHLMTAVINALIQWLVSFAPIGLLIPDEIKDGIMSGEINVVQAAKDLIKNTIQAFKDKERDFEEAAKNLIKGFIRGLKSTWAGKAISAAAELGNQIIGGLNSKEGLDEHSPSKRGEESGEYLVDGIVEGITKKTPDAVDAATELGGNVGDAVQESTEKGLDGVDGILDGVVKSAKNAAAEVANSTGLIKNNTAATYRDALIKAKQTKRFNEQQEAYKKANAVTEENTKVTEANTEATTKSSKAKSSSTKETKKQTEVTEYANGVLSSFVEHYGKMYEKLGDTTPIEIGTIAIKKLAESTYMASVKAKKAKDMNEETKVSIEDMIKAFTEMKYKIYDSVQSMFEGDNFFQKFELKTEKSMENILEAMRSNVDGVMNWTNKIAELGNKGLNEGLLKQLAELGPKGFEYVNAFSNATTEQIQEANTLFAKAATLPESSSNTVVASYAQAGMNAVLGFKNGMDQNAASAFTSAENLGLTTLTELEKALEEHSPSKRTYRDGKYLVEGLHNGISTSIEKAVYITRVLCEAVKITIETHLAREQFVGYGQNIGEGLAEGMWSSMSLVEAAARGLSEAAAAITVGFNKIHSPSRLYRGYGEYIGKGLALGMDGSTDYVEASARNLSEAIKKSIDLAASLIDSDMTIRPVVSPILDLKNLKAKAGSIGAMFPARSIALASSIGIGRTDGTSYESVQNQSSTPQQITFTQNNYSPKALSRVEIYRNTKNQLSMMEGVIRANA